MSAAPVKSEPQFLDTLPKIRIYIEGEKIDVSALNLDQTSRYLVRRQNEHVSNWIVTLNWEMVSRAFLNKNYRNELARATLFVPDGAPVVWWMRFLNQNKNLHPERVAGVDLILSILNRIAGTSLRIGIIGGRELSQSLKRLNFPLEQAGFLWDGPVYDRDDAQVKLFAQEVTKNALDFVFLALPSTKQTWLGPRLLELCPHITIVGVGGTFDYLGNRKRRAPLILQRLHLEWFWRLTTEPRTASRYLLLYPLGCFLLCVSWLKNKLGLRRALKSLK